MARVKVVSAARQRYARVPVIDPATGEQEIAETERTTRRGRTVTRKVSEPDYTKPLPPRACERCQAELSIGKPYKKIAIKRQRGGVTRYRCLNCPDWQPWEYSNSLSARIQEIQSESPNFEGIDNEEDARSEIDSFVSRIRELAEEKQESFDNMPEGFQQGDTGQQLEEAVDGLSSWADEIENVDLPEYPEAENEECSECEGTGEIGEGEEAVECENCNAGEIEGEEPTEEQIDTWRQEVLDAVQGAIDNCPL